MNERPARKESKPDHPGFQSLRFHWVTYALRWWPVERISNRIGQINQSPWVLPNNRSNISTARIHFPRFSGAFAFVTRVALLAEKNEPSSRVDHAAHNAVEIRATSHDAREYGLLKGMTCLAEIDDYLARKPKPGLSFWRYAGQNKERSSIHIGVGPRIRVPWKGVEWMLTGIEWTGLSVPMISALRRLILIRLPRRASFQLHAPAQHVATCASAPSPGRVYLHAQAFVCVLACDLRMSAACYLAGLPGIPPTCKPVASNRFSPVADYSPGWTGGLAGIIFWDLSFSHTCWTDSWPILPSDRRHDQLFFSGCHPANQGWYIRSNYAESWVIKLYPLRYRSITYTESWASVGLGRSWTAGWRLFHHVAQHSDQPLSALAASSRSNVRHQNFEMRRARCSRALRWLPAAELLLSSACSAGPSAISIKCYPST